MNTTRCATLPGKSHLMGHHDHGHAVAGEIGHDFQDLIDHFRVERRRRLVEEHDFRFHRQRAGDGDALLLAAREIGRIGVGFVGNADPLQEFAGDLFRLAPCRDL